MSSMYWHTKDDTVIYIPKMTDEHLKNAATYMIKKMLKNGIGYESIQANLGDNAIFLELASRGYSVDDLNVSINFREMFTPKEQVNALTSFSDWED